jgi:hypothetical protein
MTSRGSATAKDGGRCGASVIAMPSESGDALRVAGLMEFSDNRAGFMVEGGGTERPFLVAFAGPASGAGEQVAAYAAALRAVGMRVEPDSDDEQTLRVWPT